MQGDTLKFGNLLNPQNEDQATLVGSFWAERILSLSTNSWLKQNARRALKGAPQLKYQELLCETDTVLVAPPLRVQPFEFLPNARIPCVQVWTDGACSNNANPEKRISGVGVYFGPGDPKNISCKAPPPHTNNRAEMRAIVMALKACPDMIDMVVHSDSEYVMKPIMDGRFQTWSKRHFEGLKNVDLWRELEHAIKRKRQIRWVWVKGHSNCIGNIEADKLAVQGAERN